MLDIELTINQETYELKVQPGERLYAVLRRLGFSSVKFGDEHGISGADTVLLDGKPVNSYLLLAAQADGHQLETLEQMGEHPSQGWKESRGLHILQQEFVKNGAIQCGYCTPAQILAAKEQEYVLAARAVGMTDRRIIIRHLLPNAIASALVFAMSGIVLNMLFTASLSFLGLGIQPPHPEWGTMIAEGRAFMLTSPRLTILPGLAGGSPLGSASTCSMPSSTWPQTVYCLSRKVASSKTMKNWLLALCGLLARAIEQTPRTCGSSLNSACRSGLSDPPMPVPCGQPPCAMKPSITRWNFTPA